MIATSLALVALALSALHPPPAYALRPQPVRVVHYSPGVMERVLQIRTRQGYAIPRNVDGYVSRPNCGTIGQVVYLRIEGSRRLWRLAQVDCSQYRDRARHVRENLVEVGWPVAVQSGLYRDGHGRGLLWGQ